VGPVVQDPVRASDSPGTRAGGLGTAKIAGRYLDVLDRCLSDLRDSLDLGTDIF